MIQKDFTHLQHVIGERCFQFFCEPSSPIAEVKDALFQFMAYVAEIEKKLKQNEQKSESVDAPIEQKEAE